MFLKIVFVKKNQLFGNKNETTSYDNAVRIINDVDDLNELISNNNSQFVDDIKENDLLYNNGCPILSWQKEHKIRTKMNN